jgi:hypothetical protein
VPGPYYWEWGLTPRGSSSKVLYPLQKKRKSESDERKKNNKRGEERKEGRTDKKGRKVEEKRNQIQP